MKKVVVFNGSPRKNGYSAQLTEEALRGARSVGAEIKTYDLNDSGIRGCQSCFRCRSVEGCSVDDYLQPMYGDLRDAAAVVFASPIYFYDIAGQAKVWLDRMFPLVGPDFRPRCPGKKALAVYSQGDGNEKAFQDAIHKMTGIFSGLGWDVVECILCAGTSAPDFALSDELRRRAFDAGMALVS